MKAYRHVRPLILCVDDQATGPQLDLFRRVLEVSGYAVLTAVNAFEALQIFRKKQPDVVLTEHIRIAPFGGTLAAIMKKLKPRVPVAIYSADLAESPDDMRFADGFITKLVPVDELLSTLHGLLEKAWAAMAA